MVQNDWWTWSHLVFLFLYFFVRLGGWGEIGSWPRGVGIGSLLCWHLIIHLRRIVKFIWTYHHGFRTVYLSNNYREVWIHRTEHSYPWYLPNNLPGLLLTARNRARWRAMVDALCPSDDDATIPRGSNGSSVVDMLVYYHKGSWQTFSLQHTIKVAMTSRAYCLLGPVWMDIYFLK